MKTNKVKDFWKISTFYSVMKEVRIGWVCNLNSGARITPMLFITFGLGTIWKYSPWRWFILWYTLMCFITYIMYLYLVVFLSRSMRFIVNNFNYKILSQNLISCASIKRTHPPLYKKLKLKFTGFLKNHLKLTQYNVQHRHNQHFRVLRVKLLHIFGISQKR